jgi:hypothetical protein
MVHAEQGVGIEPVQVMARFREEEPGRPPQIQQVSTLILLHAVFFKLRLEIGGIGRVCKSSV